MSPTSAPSPAVLDAFRITAEPRPLVAPTWIAGDVVLKPETDPGLPAWLGEEASRVRRAGYRLADPVPARDGSWVVEGWGATSWVAGTSVPESGPTDEKWALALEGGRAFHRSLVRLDRPDFADGRTPDLLDVLQVSVPAVARAMLFRLWTTHERVTAGVGLDDLEDEARAYSATASALGLGQ